MPPSFDAAIAVLKGMAGLNGIILPDAWSGLLSGRLTRVMAEHGIGFGPLPIFSELKGTWTWLAALWILAWTAPNTQQIMARFKPALEHVRPLQWVRWQPTTLWLGVTAGCLLYAMTEMGKVSEFLYFQF